MHFASRAELLIATVRYVDEANGLEERLQRCREASNSIEALDAYVEFWGNYIPEIYGLAKALIAMYDTDEAAAAAWDDRMQALRDGCHGVFDCLERDQALALGWNVAEATDMMWTMLSVSLWENLTRACGWSMDQYVRRMQVALKLCEINVGAKQNNG